LRLREAIVDTAVTIAERSSWEAVHLFDVASELNISLDDIRAHFREKEDLVDAWFDRADSQMLKAAETVEFLSLSPRERLHHLIMAWLDALAAHRKVTRQMIGAKLEPGHLHIQIPAIHAHQPHGAMDARSRATRCHFCAPRTGRNRADHDLSGDIRLLDAR
jgi:ubiquinone biosynthesis protein COQ9